MNSLFANTTNHRRAIIFVAAAVLGVIIVLILYQAPFAIRIPVESGVMGLLVFEVMFRTRTWLNLSTLIVYTVSATVISQILYSILYGGFSFQSLFSAFSVFSNNLYALCEMSIVTGLAYYLIKIYRYETWVITGGQAVDDASNKPVYENEQSPLLFRAWLRKYNQQIISFFGWYLVNGFVWGRLGGPDYYGILILFVFAANILTLIVLALIKRTRKIAMGMILALAFNFIISLILGLSTNATCFIPFYIEK